MQTHTGNQVWIDTANRHHIQHIRILLTNKNGNTSFPKCASQKHSKWHDGTL